MIFAFVKFAEGKGEGEGGSLFSFEEKSLKILDQNDFVYCVFLNKI